jgi:hypothetical protein
MRIRTRSDIDNRRMKFQVRIRDRRYNSTFRSIQTVVLEFGIQGDTARFKVHDDTQQQFDV